MQRMSFGHPVCQWPRGTDCPPAAISIVPCQQFEPEVLPLPGAGVVRAEGACKMKKISGATIQWTILVSESINSTICIES
jgi:hypothetical protein